jgi:hypothetical protein
MAHPRTCHDAPLSFIQIINTVIFGFADVNGMTDSKIPEVICQDGIQPKAVAHEIQQEYNPPS